MVEGLNLNQSSFDEVFFVEKHFTKIAFAVAAFVHFILSPLSMILGSAASLAAHRYFQLEQKLETADPVVTITQAVFTIVGASAALISISPAGALGGVVFQLVPCLSYFAIGNFIHRAIYRK